MLEDLVEDFDWAVLDHLRVPGESFVELRRLSYDYKATTGANQSHVSDEAFNDVLFLLRGSYRFSTFCSEIPTQIISMGFV